MWCMSDWANTSEHKKNIGIEMNKYPDAWGLEVIVHL